MESIVTHENCMALMARYPDKHFDLAVVDPEYGINVNHNMGRRSGDKKSEYKRVTWDKNHVKKYVIDLIFRVSKNQIIWGANHFISIMPYNSPCWLIWDKKFSDEVTFAQFEMAWTSFKSTCKKFDRFPNGSEIRIHPTQKPVALYDWIFKNYAKQGDKILDTHLGSGSSRIAAYKAGLYFVGCELDKDYYEASVKRFEDYIKQETIFSPHQLNMAEAV